MHGRCTRLGPGQCFVCGCNGASPGRVGRAECSAKVRSGPLRGMWQSTALSSQVGLLACASGGGRAQDPLGLECRRFSPLSAPPKKSGPSWPCDSDLDLATGMVALRPGLTASVPRALLPATFPLLPAPFYCLILEHPVRRPL